MTTDTGVTRTYHALALDFSLTFDDADLAEYWHWLLAAFPSAPRAEISYEIFGAEADSARMERDGEVVLGAADNLALVASFVQWLNQQAVDIDYAVSSHAGGVARGGAACVLPADPESGKTTLTTGLVRAGYDYLTDEAVAFHTETGAVEAYPKPLAIDFGSQHLFPELDPPLPPRSKRPEAGQWQVPPGSIRPDVVAGPCRARWVVFPKYEEGATTRLEPVPRAEALVELAKNTFRFREHPRRALDTLSLVVRDVDCYRLRVGDLDEAVDRVAELMERDGG